MAKAGDSLFFKSGISFRYAVMPFKSVNPIFEFIFYNSGATIFDYSIKQNKDEYVFSIGVQYAYLKFKLPDYTILNHNQFDIVKVHTRKELYDMLGVKKIDISNITIPIYFSYFRTFNKISPGISTGILFNHVINYPEVSNNIVKLPQNISDDNIGIIFNKNWLRTFTEIKIKYVLNSRLGIETGIETNVTSFLFPQKKSDFIEEEIKPWRSFHNTPYFPANTNNSPGYINKFYINLSLNRIKQINYFFKINYTL